MVASAAWKAEEPLHRWEELVADTVEVALGRLAAVPSGLEGKAVAEPSVAAVAAVPGKPAAVPSGLERKAVAEPSVASEEPPALA